MSASQAEPSRIHAWVAARTPWQRRSIALLAGAGATLGHAPFQLTPVYAAALVVLIWLLDAAALRERRIGSAFAIGWWFGLGHMTSGLYWVASAFLVDAEAWGPLWGVPAALALGGAMALYWAFGCALAMCWWTPDARRLPAFAAALFVSEWLRGHLFGGFPWILPGYVWAPGEPISQLASLFGIYGLSLLTLLAGAAPAAIADASAKPGGRFAPLVVAALAIGMGWGWGAQRLVGAAADPPGAQSIVRVADSGLSQAEKWASRSDQEWRVLQRYLDASGSSNDSRATIVVWPEGAIPVVNFFMLENPDFMDALGRGLGDRVLVAGLSRRQSRADGVVYFNSAVVIDGVGGVARVSQFYDKSHLVPFGEFIPLWSLVSSLNIAPLQRIGAGFEAGAPPSRLIVPGAPPAIVLICYEAIFPGLTPRGLERPGWIISVTNDAWFGDLNWFTGPWQHFAMARYRAIEEGLPMVRSASGGVSAIIDSYGRAITSTYRRGGHAEAQIPRALVETPMARYGNGLVLALLAFVVGLRFLPPRRATGEPKR